jgi:hypothetical protein
MEGNAMKRPLQGIALILFGILLGIAEGDLNSYLVHHFEAFPFAAVGLVIGLVGLILAFQREK